MKTPKEIVIETILHYTVEGNARSISDNGDSNCLYQGPKGTECAFARLIKDEYKSALFEYEGIGIASIFGGIGIESNFDGIGMDIIKDEYNVSTNNKILFWTRIQRIHDNTLIRYNTVDDLIDEINDDFKSFDIKLTKKDLPGLTNEMLFKVI